MVTINNSINNTVGASNSGVTNTLTLTNSSNTASSQSQEVLNVGGATSGDAFTTYTVTGVTSWSMGVDNSVTSPTVDTFVISQGTALGTNNIMTVATSGEINYPLQPAVLAYIATDDVNVTGNNTSYTVGTSTAFTEVFDQNSDFNTNGTFTAPVTGRYWISYQIKMLQATLATLFTIRITTSNRSYIENNTILASPATQIGNIKVLADLDAADTATFSVILNGIGADTADIAGGADPFTHVSISLDC